MENNKCYDCGKIIEPDKELRFYPEQEVSAAAERFLCEVCADRRRAEASDPFYSEANRKWLLESIQAAEAGKLTEHELIEVEDEESSN